MVESFTQAWNRHPVRTENNRSPEQIWLNGVIDQRNASVSHIAELHDSSGTVEDLQWYGFDPYAPSPIEDGLCSVVVDDAENVLSEEQLRRLIEIDPLQESCQYGIDIFLNACEILLMM